MRATQPRNAGWHTAVVGGCALLLVICCGGQHAGASPLDPVPVPTIEPDGGLFLGSLTVMLTCTMPEAEVRFTLDGTEPSVESTLYVEPIVLTETTVVSARAYLGDESSTTASALFRRKQPLGPVDVAAVHLSGRLGARYDANVEYLIALHDQAIPAIAFDMHYPFLNRGDNERSWDGEYAGKWLDAASLVAANTGSGPLSERLEPFANTLCGTQESDGYMGIELTRGGSWDMWNMWYVLWGTLSHFERLDHLPSYQCAADTGAYIVANYLPPDPTYNILAGAWGGGCTVDVLDQLMRLYGHSAEPDLLALGDHISENFAAIEAMRASGAVHLSHAYVVSAYLGGMTAYNEARGNVDDLNWLESVWQDIVDHHLFHTYSVGQDEQFKDPSAYALAVNKQETCATVEWLLWTSRLYEATGDLRYVEQIENTVYNALLGAQNADGMAWTYHTPMNAGTKSWFGGPTKCCYWSGPRGIARLPLHLYHTDADGLRVDLYESSTAVDIDVNGVLVDITQTTEYPADGQITLTLGLETSSAFQLKLRIPGWTTVTGLSVNGVDAGVPAVPGEYAVLDAVWHDGNQVQLHLDLPVTLRSTNGLSGIDGAALQRGPEVLALDSRDNPGVDLDSVSLYLDPKVLACDPVDSRRRYASPVLLDGSAAIVFFTPFADAGNQGASYRTVLPLSGLATPSMPGDTNGDVAVDVDDLINVILDWGSDGSSHGADVDHSGVVDVNDLIMVIVGWGPCP